MKTIRSVLIVISLLFLAAAVPNMLAVVPAPDGGYPGFNTAEGQNALFSQTTGVANTGVGWRSLFSNTDGSFNTGVGAGTLVLNVGNQSAGEGVENTAVGTTALLFNTTGARNTAVGSQALQNNNTGHSNTAIGYRALALRTSGTGSSALGSFAGFNVTTADSVLCLNHVGANVTGTTWISGVYSVQTQSGLTAPVIVSGDGQLGTVVSSERFKKDIATIEKASEAIMSLRPVTFHYKTDTKETPQFGLIAEEVAKVNPALVLPDKEGKPYTVRYEAVNAMLLNEFLKEHRKVQKLEAALDTVNARLEQQEMQLQQVTAQIEISKSAQQVASRSEISRLRPE